ncbi:hypothetical protein [Streptomyces sp. NPDC094472]
MVLIDHRTGTMLLGFHGVPPLQMRDNAMSSAVAAKPHNTPLC